MGKRFELKRGGRTLAALSEGADGRLILEHNLTFDELRTLPTAVPVDAGNRVLRVQDKPPTVGFYDDSGIVLNLGRDKFGFLDVSDPKEIAGLRTPSAPVGDHSIEIGLVLQLGPFYAVRIYGQRVLQLYDQVDNWLADTVLTTNRLPHTVIEEIYGSYEMPLLQIADSSGKRVATLIPTGAAVIGALGRVEISGSQDREGLVYFAQGGPQVTVTVGSGPSATQLAHQVFKGVAEQGWYWIENARLGRAKPLDEELLKDLIKLVADFYEL